MFHVQERGCLIIKLLFIIIEQFSKIDGVHVQVAQLELNKELFSVVSVFTQYYITNKT